jgi:hypothetical protein
VTGRARAPLSLAPDEADQVPRLNRFRQAHPGIAIHAGSGYWQAQIPEPAGEQIITRYRLRELLDELDTLTSDPGVC